MKSDVYGDGTPAKQAEAYVELLDNLGIDKGYLLATSAGGSIAIRFTLDYLERQNKRMNKNKPPIAMDFVKVFITHFLKITLKSLETAF